MRSCEVFTIEWKRVFQLLKTIFGNWTIIKNYFCIELSILINASKHFLQKCWMTNKSIHLFPIRAAPQAHRATFMLVASSQLPSEGVPSGSTRSLSTDFKLEPSLSNPPKMKKEFTRRTKHEAIPKLKLAMLYNLGQQITRQLPS